MVRPLLFTSSRTRVELREVKGTPIVTDTNKGAIGVGSDGGRDFL